ncbi:MAG: APC family permease, partial [Firmicutes bacterium]|nr:APC family permease [Bacillota bacterium]
VMGSFLIMIVLGFVHWQTNPFTPFMPEGQTLLQSVGLGIAICMWMYSGYESMSTMAGEIKNPQVIPRATILSVPAIMLIYILPTIAGLASVGNWQQWSTEGGISFATVAGSLGLPAFGVLFAIAAIVSNISLYNTYLASGSRGFYSMAEDKLFPKMFGDIHPKYGTPYKAIISMAIVNLILCQYGFDVLVVIDVFLLMFAYVLIYIAAIVLRIKEPGLKRPFKVPMGTKGLILFCAAPVFLAGLALFTNGTIYFIGGCLGVLSGPVAYFFLKRKYGGPEQEKKVSSGAKKAAVILSCIMVVFIAVAGVSIARDRAEAKDELTVFSSTYLLTEEVSGVKFDWGDELYRLDVTAADGLEYSIYYDDGFYAQAELTDYYDSAESFSTDAFKVLRALGELPVDHVNIISGQYRCDEVTPDEYASAAALSEAVGKVF